MGKIKDLTVDPNRNLHNAMNKISEDLRNAFMGFGNRYTRSDRSGHGPYTSKPGESKLVYDVGQVVLVNHQGEEEFFKVGNEYMYSDGSQVINYRVYSFKNQRWDWLCLNEEDIVQSTDVRKATQDEANLVENLFDAGMDPNDGITQGYHACDGSTIPMAGLSKLFENDMKLNISNGVATVTGTYKVYGSISFITVDAKIT